MKNVGDSTTKRPGSGLISTGLFVAAIGAFLAIMVGSQGNMPSVLVWVMLLGGLILAAVGFGKRVLAAVESR